MKDDDALSEAAATLNHRLVAAHGRVTAISVVLTTVAGLAACAAAALAPGVVTGIGVLGWLGAAVVAAVGFGAAACVLAVCNLVARVLGRRRREHGLNELAQRYGVDRGALADLCIPIGQAAPSSAAQAGAQRMRKRALIAAAAWLGVVVLLFALGLQGHLRVLLVGGLLVSVAATMHGYLWGRGER
jgi:hypothetical protein